MKINRQQVLDKFQSKCGYCGKDINLKSMQIDHIIPKCQVNKNNYETINGLDNLMPSCRSCNHYKRGDNLEQFRYKISTLHKRVCSHYIGKVAIDYKIVEIEPFKNKFYFETYDNQNEN